MLCAASRIVSWTLDPGSCITVTSALRSIVTRIKIFMRRDDDFFWESWPPSVFKFTSLNQEMLCAASRIVSWARDPGSSIRRMSAQCSIAARTEILKFLCVVTMIFSESGILPSRRFISINVVRHIEDCFLESFWLCPGLQECPLWEASKL